MCSFFKETDISLKKNNETRRNSLTDQGYTNVSFYYEQKKV